MITILLVSGRDTLRQELSEVLPRNWSLSSYPTVKDLQNHPGLTSPSTENDFTVLIDVNDQPHWAGQLADLSPLPGRVVAVIEDVSQREIVLRSGADDYLFHPFHAAEIERRLHPRRDDRAVIRMLRAQLSRRDRQATVGRLTSHICHEISNSMQATRGALALALEEPDLPPGVASYITLCQQETQRVVGLVGRMRQVYRPDLREWEPLAVESLIREAITAASEEMNNSNIRLVEEFASHLQPVSGQRDQIYLAFLSLLLNLSEAVRAAGTGELRVSLQMAAAYVELAIRGDIALLEDESASGVFPPAGSVTSAENFLGLSTAAEIIRRHSGSLEVQSDGREVSILIKLPAVKQAPQGDSRLG